MAMLFVNIKVEDWVPNEMEGEEGGKGREERGFFCGGERGEGGGLALYHVLHVNSTILLTTKTLPSVYIYVRKYGSSLANRFFLHFVTNFFPHRLVSPDVVAMLMDPISFATKALEELAKGDDLVRKF